MATTKVSLEELNACRTNEMQSSVSAFPVSRKHLDYSDKSFIEKLTKSDIVSFFSRFGYLAHGIETINNNPTLVVNCKDLDIMTDGFTFAYSFHPTHEKDNSGFELEKLQKFCDTTGSSVEQILTTTIESKLFASRFPNYPSKKQRFDSENQNYAERTILNHQMRELFSASSQVMEAERMAKYDYASLGYVRATQENQRTYSK